MTDDDGLDPRGAAELIARTAEHTRRSLSVRLPVVYTAWGAAWLVGLGGMWLSVRGQDPYRGPDALSATILGVLLVGAVAVTMITVSRGTRGVRGNSQIQGTIFGLSWPIGYAALFALIGAVGRRGASDQVMGLLGSSGPLLITGVIFVLGAAIWLDRSMVAVGCWLALVAGMGAFTGPVTVLLIDAIAGGGGFLAAAGYLSARKHP